MISSDSIVDIYLKICYKASSLLFSEEKTAVLGLGVSLSGSRLA
jgi:hypothetical protein